MTAIQRFYIFLLKLAEYATTKLISLVPISTLLSTL